MAVIIGLAYAYVQVGYPPIPAQISSGMQTVGNHMRMLEPTAADSFTPKADSLSEAGWTATASDQSATHPASSAIDGNSATIWNSKNGVRLPHSITINLHKTTHVSGLTYLPRQDGSANGDIGQYKVTVSTNGRKWSAPVATGTWADDQTLKTAVFGGVSAHYVRLTALTEAGNRGPWTTAAEIGLLNDPPMGPALPRTGWTVSATSQQPIDRASYVLDGDGLTMWQT